MAALSLSTLPSGSCSVGICFSGLARASSASASFCSHDAVSTMRYAAPVISSAHSTDAEPEPSNPNRVYMNADPTPR